MAAHDYFAAGGGGECKEETMMDWLTDIYPVGTKVEVWLGRMAGRWEPAEYQGHGAVGLHRIETKKGRVHHISPNRIRLAEAA